MTIFEIDRAIDGMHVIVDTREQTNEKAVERWKSFGCPIVREKLDFGDYSARFIVDGKVVFDLSKAVTIERKYDLTEIAACFCGQRDRFIREFERAKNAGAKTYLLIENASWEKAYNGSYRSQMSPKAMIASLTTWLARYNCQLIMCRAETSGKLIAEILKREAKERMQAGD